VNLNPLDLAGPVFLAFYAFLLVIAHVVGKALTRMCGSSRATSEGLPESLPVIDAAFLAGGRERAIETALVPLMRNNWIAAKPRGGFELTTTRPGPLADLQADVYREISRNNTTLEGLRRMRSVFLDRVELHLASAGLLLARDSAEATCARFAKCLPFLAAMALGVAKLGIGIERHRPVAFISLFLVASLIILGIKFFNLPLRTAKGDRALDKLKRRNAALQTTVRRRAGELDDAFLLMAIALYSPAVLADGELAWMRPALATRQSGSSDSGGSSCGSSSGGGCGGGGGGCGGCGG